MFKQSFINLALAFCLSLFLTPETNAQGAGVEWNQICQLLVNTKCTAPIQSVVAGYGLQSIVLSEHATCLEKGTAEATCKADTNCMWCPITTPGGGETYQTKYGPGACLTKKLGTTVQEVNLCKVFQEQHVQIVQQEEVAANVNTYPKFVDQATCLKLSEKEADCKKVAGCGFCPVPKDIYNWQPEGGLCFASAYLDQKIGTQTRCEQLRALQALTPSVAPVTTEPSASEDGTTEAPTSAAASAGLMTHTSIFVVVLFLVCSTLF